ncbi:MAG TPA: MBL fold metallo-hydrolase [Vicinamibacterales bacterium]|nr:MBL fold metallo-hydrolase [Vicinamibacterales bacterium]
MRMHYVLACAVALSAAASAATLHAQRGAPLPEKATSKAAQDLIAHAMAIAKDDLKSEAADACLPGGPARDPDPRPMQTVEPLKVFDNLYYVGFEQVGTWTLDTGDGLILFDTLNNPREAEEVLVPGLKQLGLDPANIKYIVLSHGHADHFGGAPYFQEHYHTPVMMTAADWDLIARPPGPNASAAARNRVLPTRDRVINDGDTLTLGNATIRFGIYPGHTPGTIMMTVPVLDHGVRRVWLVPAGALQVPDKPSLRAFEHVINDYFRKDNPEMVFNSHPLTMNDGLAKMAAIRSNPNAPNPFIIGKERTARYLDIMLACRKAWVVEKDPSAL